MNLRHIALTDAFYHIPELPSLQEFPVPPSAEGLIDFFQNEEGRVYREKVHSLLLKFMNWCRIHFPNDTVPPKALIPYNDAEKARVTNETNRLALTINHFESRFHQAPGDVDSRAAKFGLFTKGVAALQHIADIIMPSTEAMQQKAILNKERHLSLIKELIETMDFCSSGAEKKILDTAGVISEDLDEFLYSIRLQLANQIAKEKFREAPYIRDSYSGNEVHHINYLLDLSSDLIKIRFSLDPLAGSSDDNYLLEAIENLVLVFTESYTKQLHFDYIIDQLLERAGIHAVYDNLNYSNCAQKLLYLQRGLAFIGKDKCLDKKLEHDKDIFLHKDVRDVLEKDLDISDEMAELTSLKNILVPQFDLEIQLRISIVQRLKTKGLFHLLYETHVLNLENDMLFILSNASLSYSYVILNKGKKRIPYLFYLTSLLSSNRLVAFQQNIAFLSGLYLIDIIDYLKKSKPELLYVFHDMVLFAAFAGHSLQSNCIKQIKVLFQYLSSSECHQYFIQKNLYMFFMNERNKEAIEYVMDFIPSDYFLTFIANKSIEEITFLLDCSKGVKRSQLITDVMHSDMAPLSFYAACMNDCLYLDDSLIRGILEKMPVEYYNQIDFSPIPFPGLERWLNASLCRQLFFSNIVRTRFKASESVSLEQTVQLFLLTNYAYTENLDCSGIPLISHSHFSYLRTAMFGAEFISARLFLELMYRGWDDTELMDEYIDKVPIKALNAFYKTAPQLFFKHKKYFNRYVFDRIYYLLHHHPLSLDHFMQKLANSLGDEKTVLVLHSVFGAIYEHHYHEQGKEYIFDIFKALPQRPTRLQTYLRHVLEFHHLPISIREYILIQYLSRSECMINLHSLSAYIQLSDNLVEAISPLQTIILHYHQSNPFSEHRFSREHLMEFGAYLNSDKYIDQILPENLCNLDKNSFYDMLLVNTGREDYLFLKIVGVDKHRCIRNLYASLRYLKDVFSQFEDSAVFAFLCHKIEWNGRSETVFSCLVRLFGEKEIADRLGDDIKKRLLAHLMSSTDRMGFSSSSHLGRFVLAEGSDGDILAYFKQALTHDLQPTVSFISQNYAYDNRMLYLFHRALNVIRPDLSEHAFLFNRTLALYCLPLLKDFPLNSDLTHDFLLDALCIAFYDPEKIGDGDDKALFKLCQRYICQEVAPLRLSVIESYYVRMLMFTLSHSSPKFIDRLTADGEFIRLALTDKIFQFQNNDDYLQVAKILFSQLQRDTFVPADKFQLELTAYRHLNCCKDTEKVEIVLRALDLPLIPLDYKIACLSFKVDLYHLFEKVKKYHASRFWCSKSQVAPLFSHLSIVMNVNDAKNQQELLQSSQFAEQFEKFLAFDRLYLKLMQVNLPNTKELEHLRHTPGG